MNSTSESASNRGRDVAELAIFLVIAVGAVGGAQALGPTTSAGNIVAMVGVLGTLAVALVAPRLRGEGWASLGLSRPESWGRTVLHAIGATLVVILVSWLLQSVIVPALFGEETADTSRFDSLRGNVVRLIGTVVVVWLTAAFAEEVIYRGFLMGRLARVFGGARDAWAAGLMLSTVLFAGLHFYQGPVGMLGTGTVGFLLGLAYLLSGRNLWVTILTHGLVDTLALTLIFFGLG